MNEAATIKASPGGARNHVFFALLIVVSVIVTLKTWAALVQYSLHDDSYSHILLIPIISIFLIYTERRTIFGATHFSILPGSSLLAVGLAGYWLATHRGVGSPSASLTVASLSIIVMLSGGFLLCYGRRAARAALFPLAFLVLMVPLPDSALQWTVRQLQEGSTEIAFVIFKACGVPVLRQGFVLSLPSVSIEVASECSSIRSSIGLLITCVLAAHFFLRTTWKAWLFTALVIPLSVIKNGIRIATLTLLAIYVDPSFLTGSLHRDGGFVFFLLALAILWPILIALQKSERGKVNSTGQPSSPETAAGYARS